MLFDVQAALDAARAFVAQRTGVLTELIAGGHMRMAPTVENETFAEVRFRKRTYIEYSLTFKLPPDCIYQLND